MDIKKILVGSLAFFLAYIGVDYLFDSKIDFVLAITCTIGYLIGTIIYYKAISKKK